MDKQQIIDLIARVQEDEYRKSNGDERLECKTAVIDQLKLMGFSQADADNIYITADRDTTRF